MDKQIKARWVEALRSGSYAQGKHTLRSSAEKYCCLGVLCDIAIQDGQGQWYDLAAPSEDRPYWNFRDVADGFSQTGLTRRVMNWAGVGPLTQDSLILMNDQDGAPFEQIAQYIEENL